jgi:hypothetical protein
MAIVIARARGTRRFQRAVMGKGVLIGIERHEVATLAPSDYHLQSRASWPEHAAGDFDASSAHDCALEATRTQSHRRRAANPESHPN